MAAFKDQNGKEWTVTLDAPKIRSVRNECKLDLAAIDDRPYERMYDDTILLVDVLWVLCREQAQKANITDVQFGEALVGDTIERATEAVLAAILDFFPSRKRTLLQTLASKGQRLREVSIAKAMERLNDPGLEERLLAAMDAQTEAALNEAISKLTPSTSATSLPESSASTPAG